MATKPRNKLRVVRGSQSTILGREHEEADKPAIQDIFADPPFETELSKSDYHPKTLNAWTPDAIYAWMKEQVIASGALNEGDAKFQYLRQLADQYHMQCKCRFEMHHMGMEAKIGRQFANAVLSRTQKDIRDIMKSFGVDRTDLPSQGTGSGGIKPLPDEAFA